MSIKSDLASEIIEGISKKNLPKTEYHRFGSVDVTKIEILPGYQSKAAGRPAGKYISVEAESVLDPTANSDEEIAALAAELAALLPRHGTVLAVGVGNEALVADSLGDKIRHRADLARRRSARRRPCRGAHFAHRANGAAYGRGHLPRLRRG